MTTRYGFDWGFSELQQELYPLTDMATMYQAVAPLRPKYWRMMADWQMVCKAQDPGTTVAGTPPTTTNRDWSSIDRCINDILLTVGSDIIMIIGQARPSWNTNGGGGIFAFLFFFFGGSTGPTPADYGNFCKEVAQRYQPGGVGIRTDGIYAPNAGKGVTKFEIWNEQNNAMLWTAPISPTDYVAYLKAGYAGIKSVLPGSQSTVIFGGLMHAEFVGDYWGYGYNVLDEYNFLTRCYQLEPHLGNYYDAMATHFYTESDTVASPPAPSGTVVGPAPVTNTDNFRQIQAIHTLMTSNGDGAKNIWITECGFGTQSLTQAQQSTYMQQAFANLGTLPYIAAVIIFNIRDLSTDYSNWNNTFGMMTYGFVQKAIWPWLEGLTPHGGVLNLGLAFSGFGGTGNGGALTLGLTFSGTGKDVESGSGALSLGLTFTGTGSEKVTTSGSLSLGLSFTGTAAENTGTGTLALVLSFGGTYGEQDTASGALTLGLVFSGTGAETVTTSGGLSLPLSFSGTGVDSVFGTLTIPLSFSGTGSQPTGTGALNLSSLSFSGTGAEKVTTSGTLSLALSFSGTGAQWAGSGTLSLSSLSFSGTGTAITGPQYDAIGSGGTTNIGSSASGSTTETITVASGATIYTALAIKTTGNWVNSYTLGVTDSLGNTFTQLQTVYLGISGQSTMMIALFKCTGATGGAHTLTGSGNSGGPWVGGDITMKSISYTSAATHANITTQGSGASSNAALNVNQSSASGHRALCAANYTDSAYSSTFNQTLRGTEASGSSAQEYILIGDAPGASTVNFATTTSDSWVGAICLDMST